MRKTTVTTVTDDIDGSGKAQEIALNHRGRLYVIDLGKRNSAAFDMALESYLATVTQVPTRGRPAAARSRRPTTPASSSRDEVAKTRVCAEATVAA